MYSRADLKNSGRAYADAVKDREVTIFTRYIADGIITYAQKGLETIKFPMLEKFHGIAHGVDGLLNKHDPGPIPDIYIEEIVARLRFYFPDTDFAFNEKFLYVSWA